MVKSDNSYLRGLATDLRDRYSIDTQEMSMGDWITKNTKLAGKPFTYDRYPFQKEIADDMHPDLVCIKCSQIGLTEVQLRKAVAFAYRNINVGVAYTLPDEDLRDVASKTRMNPILEASKIFNPDYLKQMIRSNEIKQVLQSYIYMLVATESKAFSLPVDFLIIDERDLTKDDVAALFNSRMQNSDYKIKQEFSTPSFPDYGVDKTYATSDQHEFFLKCSCCGHQQLPKFNDDFVKIPGLPDHMSVFEITDTIKPQLNLMDAQIVCQKCHEPLDFSGKREWVPAYADRKDKRGYRVSPFSTDRLPVYYIVNELCTYSRNNFLRGWHNSVLGETFKDGNIRLSKEIIRRSFASPYSIEPPKGEQLSIGIDVGKLCHVVIGSPFHPEGDIIYQIHIVPSAEIVEFVADICNRYNVVTGTIDIYPYTPTSYAVMKASGGVIWPVEYTANAEMDYYYKEETGEEYIRANRTKAVDKVVQSLNDSRIRINGYGQYETELLDHLRNMIRDEQPEKKPVWKKLNDADHFFHAFTYYRLGAKVKEYVRAVRKTDNRTSLTIQGIDVPKQRGLVDKTSTIHQRIG